MNAKQTTKTVGKAKEATEQDQAPALKPAERLPTPLTAHQEIAADSLAGATLGEDGQVQMRTFGQIMRYAQMMVSSNLVQKGDTWETVVLKIQTGAEVGLGPMAAIQNIAVINNRPSIWGDAMLALCMTAREVFDQTAWAEWYTYKGEILGAGEIPLSVLKDKDRGGDLIAWAQARRAPDGQVKQQQFSLAEARHAGLFPPSKPDAAWAKYPLRMLKMRARGFALRDCYPDVLRGLYSVEEQASGATVIDVEGSKIISEGIVNPTTVAQLSETKDPLQAAGQRAQAANQATPEQPTPKNAPKALAGYKAGGEAFAMNAIEGCRAAPELKAVGEEIAKAIQHQLIPADARDRLADAMRDRGEEIAEREAMGDG